MVSPCACSEGHQFCRECISTWLEQSPTCPQRCGNLAVGSLMKLRGAENIINKFKVRCCHSGVAGASGPSPGPKNLRRRSRANLASSEADSDAGCKWVGAVEEKARHLRDECAYSEVECSCVGCDAKVLRLELAEHEASCEHRKVFCEKCAKRTKAGEMSDHLLGCKMVEIDCPQECGARVLRGDVGEHEKECANVVVSCSFAEHGCEVRGKRKKVGEHEEEAEAVVAHARLAARRAGRERERNATLEKQVSELTQSLAEKVKELEESNQTRRLEQDQASKRVQELEEQVRKLEKESQRQYGEARVTWKIEGFAAKAKAKKPLTSQVFHVQTKAGIYNLHLRVDFFRGQGSTTRGVVGLFLHNLEEHGGSANYPAGLEGTVLTIEKQAKKESIEFDETDELVRNNGLGSSVFSTDKIPGLKWTAADIPFDGNPESDVMDFLDNDTLTVSGFVHITPPDTIAI